MREELASTLCQGRRMRDGNGKGWRNEHWHIVWMGVKGQEREEDWKRKVYLQNVPDRRERGRGKFQQALLHRESYLSTKPDIAKAESPSQRQRESLEREAGTGRVCV